MYTKEDILCLGSFNVITTLLYQTLVINYSAISIRHEYEGFSNKFLIE